jgi:hypothetical protein
MSQATSTREPPPAPAAQPNGKGGFQITRTELVWPGKYNEDGSRKEVSRVSLPFQVIETINESRATREAEKHEGKTLFVMPTEGNSSVVTKAAKGARL